MAQAAQSPEIAALEKRYAAAAAARRPLDASWLLDCAFYAGKHYTEYTAKEGLREIPRDPKHARSPRPVANKIKHFVMDSYAMAKDAEAEVEVQPTNGDWLSISNARVAQAWLDHQVSPSMCGWELRRDTALFWTSLCGEGWHKWTIAADRSKCRIEACSPLEIYLPPSTDTYLDARWIIHERGMDPDEVFEVYGVDLPASAVDGRDKSRTAVLREIGLDTGAPTVTVKEMWELPGRRRPAGRLVTWTGSQILQDGPFPYAHGMLPFTQIGHSPMPGTPHYTSGTREMRPLNMELNQFHAQQLTGRKKFTNFKWAIDSATRETMQELPDDSDDQVLVGDFRNGVNVPKILQPQVWPNTGDGEWLVEEMRDAVGLHEASMGGTPGRVDSASGIEQLQQGDRARLTEVQSTLVTAVGRGFGQLIELARQFITEPQLVPVYGAAGAPAVHEFTTDQFPKQPVLKVVQGGGLPRNKAAANAQIVAWFTAGLFGDITDPATSKRALELMDVPASLHVTGQEQDVMQAQCENMQLLRGIEITPQKWQNHALHRQIHNEMRNSAEFAAASSTVWSKTEFHMDMTDKVELDEIQEEAARQAHIQAVAEAVTPPAPAAPDPTAPQTPAAPAADTPPAPQPQGQAGR